MVEVGTPSARAAAAAARALATFDLPARADRDWLTLRDGNGSPRGRPRALRLGQSEKTLIGIAARVQQPSPERVVGVHHAPARVLRCEEQRLGPEVGLHRAVVVEVVLAQVREDRDVVAVTVQSVLDEGVGADLEGHGRRAPSPARGRGRAATRVTRAWCALPRASRSPTSPSHGLPAPSAGSRSSSSCRSCPSPRRCAATSPGRSRGRRRQVPSRDGRRPARRSAAPLPRPRRRAGARTRRRPHRHDGPPPQIRDRRSGHRAGSSAGRRG